MLLKKIIFTLCLIHSLAFLCIQAHHLVLDQKEDGLINSSYSTLSKIHQKLFADENKVTSDFDFVLFKTSKNFDESVVQSEISHLIVFHKSYSNSKLSKNKSLLNSLKDSEVYDTYYTKSGDLNIEYLSGFQTDTTLIRLDVLKDYLFLPDYDSNKKPVKRFSSKGKLITKDGLKSAPGKNNKIKKPLSPVQFKDQEFSITMDKSLVKDVFGYKCFVIKLESKEQKDLWYELYVTDQININYNPLLNLKICKEQGYFILEKIKFTSNTIEITKPKYIQLN